MNRTLSLILIAVVLVVSCGGPHGGQRRWRLAAGDGGDTTAMHQADDSLAARPLERFPDTTYASIEDLQWVVVVKDTTDDGLLKYLEDPYETLCAGVAGSTDTATISSTPSITTGTFTFRGNQRRDMPATGRICGTPAEIVTEWVFTTASDTTHTPYGTWLGGAGWTGQPLYVHWSDSAAAAFRAVSPALTRDFGEREIIVGSLCGSVYFINYENGRESRESIATGHIIKGSISLDPQLPNLYVGHGVPLDGPFGNVTIDLNKHCITHTNGRDPGAWRGWGAYDGSAILAGGYLFRTGENGTLYKYVREKGALKTVALLRYREKGLWGAAGIESSLAVCRNYGYFGDNRGNILCVNLDTMAPVWRYDNHDDTDATIVIEKIDGKPFIYTCSELDKQGDDADVHLVKLDGLTGEPVWNCPFPCRTAASRDKRFEGGMFATPLLGRGDCDDLIFVNICDHKPALSGFTAAVERNSGKLIWQTRLKNYAWSSPLAICNENDKMYLCVADCTGHIYLMDARSGSILFSKHIGNNFEASGVVVDDCVVIPSRGNQIFKLRIK